MAKTNASFKLDKMNKIKLGNIQDKTARNIFKKLMIGAVNDFTNGKNRKFSDPSMSQKAPNKNNTNPTI
jgi:hypothetical protein